MTQLVTFAEGEVIFRQGYPADVAYVVQSGHVEIFNEDADGSETHLAILKEGEMFGELGILDDAPRSASARALKAVTLQIVEL